MTIRAAVAADIPRLMVIRAAVRENRLVGRVIGAEDYLPYIEAGRCWVREQNNEVAGFSAIEAGHDSLWALFVAPESEGQGIGCALLTMACNAARAGGAAALTLSTEPNSRAEAFYTRFGFTCVGEDGQDVRMRMAL